MPSGLILLFIKHTLQWFPYDEEIGDCNNKGTPIVLTGSSYYAKSFIEIAARIVA